jgi:hypothetical protein
VRTLAGTLGGWRQTRRGSFLILVVGTMALLVVIAVLYVTVGRADRQTSVALSRQAREAEVSEVVGAHIASVIGNDRLDTFRSRGVSANQPTLYREAYDAPSASYDQLSTQTDPRQPDYFSPEGRGTDPWLSASDPVWLNYAQDPPDTEPLYHRATDWSVISNFSPDGRFVNLGNLRNNYDASFDQLSNFFSLLNSDGTATAQTDFNTAPDLDRPAYWSTRQRGLFRPTTGAGLGNFGNRDYLPYQYADTDGDGFFDSRWTMLTNARDRQGAPGEMTSVLPRDQRIKWFVAIRATDLAGRVNVTTATDFVQAAKMRTPAGITPADVDLRRLLRLTDFNDVYGMALNGIVTLPPPFDNDNQAPIKSPDNYNGYTPGMSAYIGDFGYKALRLAMRDGFTPDRSISGPANMTDPYFTTIPLSPVLRWEYYSDRGVSLPGVGYDSNSGTTTADDRYNLTGIFGIADLEELLKYGESNDSAVTSRLESTLSGRLDDGSPSRNTARYSPLRDTRSVRVERGGKAEDGRAPRNQIGPAESRALYQHESDLRHRITTFSAASPLRSSVVLPGSEGTLTQASDGKVDVLTMLRDGKAETLFRAYADVLARHSDIPGAWPSGGNQEFDRLRTMFYGHSGPLLPILMSAHLAANMMDSYDKPTTNAEGPGDDNRPQVRTVLFDEAFADELETDFQTPGNRTTGDPGRYPKQYDTRAYPWAWYTEGSGRFDLNNGRASTGRLANSSNGTDAPPVPALNVYGIEPQPFITEVATMTVYNDARFDPANSGGIGADDDEAPQDVPNERYDGYVTIHGRVSETNADFVCRVVAFQISNPFDSTIDLSTPENFSQYFSAKDPRFPAMDREGLYYYLEFGGETYKLASMVEQVYDLTAVAQQKRNSGLPAIADDARMGEHIQYVGKNSPFTTIEGLSIPPHSSIVCYAISEMPRDIAEKMDDQDRTASGSGRPNYKHRDETILKWIATQFGKDTGGGTDGNRRVVQIPRMDTVTGLPKFGFDKVLSDDDTLNGVAKLWRSMRVAQSVNSSGGFVDQQQEGDLEQNPQLPNRYWDNQTPPTWQGGSPAPMHYRNNPANDQLVDRFRIAAPDKLRGQLADQNNNVFGARAGPEVDDPENVGGDFENYNCGLTATFWSSVRRPNVSPDGGTLPLGAIPPYCIEPKTGSSWNKPDGYPNAATITPQKGNFDRSLHRGGAFTVKEWRTDGAVNGREVNSFIVKRADKKTGHPVTSNLAGRSFESIYREFYCQNGRFTDTIKVAGEPDRIVSTLRVGDLLLPLALGPTYAPVDSSGNMIPDQYVTWTTLAEALSIALNYENLAVLPPTAITRIYQPYTNSAGTHPMTDMGNLVLDDFAPYYDANNNGTFDIGASSNDEHVGLGIPLALNVFDVFTTTPAKYGSLTRPTPGLINLNTATMPVARVIPFLSPTTVPSEWNYPGLLFDSKSDIATTLLAYRDKLQLPLRPSSTGGAYPPDMLFQDSSGVRPDRTNLRDGRFMATNIDGIHEEQGLRTTGELLAARDVTSATNPRANPNNPDFLGYGPVGAGNSSLEGMDSILYDDDNDPATDRKKDELDNEYDQKLAIVNAVAGTTTTRSDTFAVWFLLHGYQRSDCENLGVDKPMVPTVARRFLMIIDRSNVTRLGQKPRIVLFKEMPL